MKQYPFAFQDYSIVHISFCQVSLELEKQGTKKYIKRKRRIYVKPYLMIQKEKIILFSFYSPNYDNEFLWYHHGFVVISNATFINS